MCLFELIRHKLHQRGMFYNLLFSDNGILIEMGASSHLIFFYLVLPFKFTFAQQRLSSKT